ncbi:MAG TPA: ABC transporter ATP-binding protein [Treponemataceae bacterium]|nr:ABC transporter ATP-binding protein [Treponemataceae bacterium]
MLEVRDVSRRFPDRAEPALSGVTFSVARGECVVIGGANGSGKSALMRIIAGLDEPSGGEVTVIGAEGKPARVGLVFQDADAQILGDTPLEDVEFGPRNLGLSRKEAREAALRALERAGLAGKEGLPARNLSGGEKRRLAVAGVLAMDAELIIFDEPYANLDWPGVVQVNAIIRTLKNEGKTIIILTHELEKILALAERLLILFRGKLAFDGLPDKALSSGRLADWGIKNPIASYATSADLLWI